MTTKQHLRRIAQLTKRRARLQQQIKEIEREMSAHWLKLPTPKQFPFDICDGWGGPTAADCAAKFHGKDKQ